MILRRFAKALRQQDWPAVLIEVMIVVVGVYIGLQADNWNSQRGERALEAEYIARLHADVLRSLQAQADAVRWNEQRLEQQQFLLAALRSAQLDEAGRSTFDRSLMLLGYLNRPIMHRSTLAELMSTGRMSVITDTKLRELIGRTDAEFDRRMHLNAGIESRINAYRLQIAPQFQIIDFERDANGEVELAYDFAELAADHKFVSLASHINFESRLQHLSTANFTPELERLRDALAARIDEPPGTGD